ncbi:hypothetical protein HYPSUDRAFT_46015 [Hypholoma sublateritium FD-334 SS-4]|uniref:Cupin type-2 domain-containing protein n=1 Tax=Hypholoma sublateritium (strain FD-334 SS-4) TaxID=945553 RepID=A0A0D2M3R3_HYPSF|nr:hypothetical protein HYPSUDRAFT_46015 [Hypholoma sublateritium FD-334 SS-4]
MANSDTTLPPAIKLAVGVTMTFLTNSSYITRVHIEKDVEEEFNVPAHWHERHDEIFHILEGRVEVRIGKEKRFYTPEDGEITIPRGVEHSLRVVRGEECILEEGTVPMDKEKELFFRNAFAGGKTCSSFFGIMQIMYHGDGRPVLPLHVKWLERMLVVTVGSYIAPLLGYTLPIPNLKNDL